MFDNVFVLYNNSTDIHQFPAALSFLLSSLFSRINVPQFIPDKSTHFNIYMQICLWT